MKAGVKMAGAAAAAAAAATTRRNLMARRSSGTPARTQALLNMSSSMDAGRNPVVPVEIVSTPQGIGSQFTIRITLLEGLSRDMVVKAVQDLGSSQAGGTVYIVDIMGTVADGRIAEPRTGVEQTKLCVITSNRGMMRQYLGYSVDEPSPYFELASPTPPANNTTAPQSDEDNNDMWSPVLVIDVPRQVGDIFELKMTLWGIPLEVAFQVVEDLGPQNGQHLFKVAILKDGVPGKVTDFKLLSPIMGRVLVVP